jgi:hypothetical protein
MIVRDTAGNIHIINRTDCKNDKEYYDKIYNLKLNYSKKYKSVVLNVAKKINNNNTLTP